MCFSGSLRDVRKECKFSKGYTTFEKIFIYCFPNTLSNARWKSREDITFQTLNNITVLYMTRIKRRAVEIAGQSLVSVSDLQLGISISGQPLPISSHNSWLGCRQVLHVLSGGVSAEPSVSIGTTPKHSGQNVNWFWGNATATTVFLLKYIDVKYCFLHFSREDDSIVDGTNSYFPKYGKHFTGDRKYFIGGTGTDIHFNILYLFYIFNVYVKQHTCLVSHILFFKVSLRYVESLKFRLRKLLDKQ